MDEKPQSQPVAISTDGLSIRSLEPDELEAVARFWTIDIGIPVEVKLFKRWYVYDPGAFRVIVDKNNRIVASATVVKQIENLFVLGYMSVLKDYRGKGLGKVLLRNMIQRNPRANYVLNASTDKLAMFEEQGFKREDNGFAFAYIGTFVGHLEAKSVKPADMELVRVTAADVNASDLSAYDQLVNGFVRNVAILILDDSDSVVLVAKRRTKVVGYGKIQPYISGGAWLSPLYADDPEAARCLMDGLLRAYMDKKSSVLFCITSEKGQPFAASLGLKFIDKLTRCCLKQGQAELPQMNLDKVYIFDDPGLAFL